MSSIVVKDVDQTNSLVWFRNDLRVNDHHGLKQAIENSDSVVGFYCFNPDLFVENKLGFKTVSYTHLTLPTIYSV